MGEKKGILGLLGFNNLIDNLKSLVDTKVRLLKYEIKDELAKVLANTFIAILLLNLLFFALLLMSIGFSIYLGGIMNNYLYGFGIVALVYFCFFILLLTLKDKIGLKEIIEKELNKVFRIGK